MKTTIIMPVSRYEYLDLIFPLLENLECEADKTSLLILVDGDNDLFVDVRNRATRSKFNESLVIQHKSRLQRRTNIKDRRMRIAEMHNTFKDHIQNAEYIFGIEDDTTFRRDALKMLQQNYLAAPYAGMIQGWQLGRWGFPYVGSWQVDDVYEPTKIDSKLPPEDKTQLDETDAGGFYCFLTKAENYMAHMFKPYDNNSLGPDFDYGLELRKQGYKNYTNWSIPCLHHTDKGIIDPNKTEPKHLQYFKLKKTWKQRTR